MAQQTIRQLRDRASKAHALKDQRRALNQQACELFMPWRNTYIGNNPGANRMQNLYTSLGMSTMNNAVNVAQMSLTPPDIRWVEMTASDTLIYDDKRKLNITLKRMTDSVFSYIHASNFDIASSEAYYDWLIGTGVILMQPGTPSQPLNFQSVPMSDIGLEEGVFGSVGGIFRKNKIEVRLVKPTWTDARIPSDLAALIESDQSQQVVLDEITYYDYDIERWMYCVITPGDGNNEGGEYLVKRKLTYNPWIVMRWNKCPGEVEGRGPALQALPDMSMLNESKRLASFANQIAAYGSWTAEEDGILDMENATFEPGGVTIVKNNPGGMNAPSLSAMPRTGSLNDQEYLNRSLEDAIREGMMDNRLSRQKGPVVSPTEIMETVRQSSMNLGASFGRYVFETLRPLLFGIINILEAQSLIQVPTVTVPNAITGKMEQKKVTDSVAFTKMKVLTPIARQQSVDDVQSVMQCMQMAASIHPGLGLAAYKAELLPQYVADKLGMPSEFLRSSSEWKGGKAISEFLSIVTPPPPEPSPEEQAAMAAQQQPQQQMA